MAEPTTPRTSQLYRIVALEHGTAAHGERIKKLEESHAAIDLKLGGIIEVLSQVKGGLWLAGKIVAATTALAIVGSAGAGIWHALH